MLMQRIATAVVLVPLVVAGVLLLPTFWVALIFAALLVVGAWEWARFPGAVTRPARALFAAMYVLCALAFVWPGQGLLGGAAVTAAVLLLACAGWLGGLVWVWRFPRGWASTLGRRDAATAAGLLVLCAAGVAVRVIHATDARLLLVLLVLVWGADTGAYCAGRLLGRHKLAPAVSPGKTVEGALGGMLTALLVAAVGAVLLG